MILAERSARLEAEARAQSVEALMSGARLEIERLKLLLAKARREQYGRSSERGARIIAQLELQLAELEETAAEDETPPRSRRRIGSSAGSRAPASRRAGRCRSTCLASESSSSALQLPGCGGATAQARRGRHQTLESCRAAGRSSSTSGRSCERRALGCQPPGTLPVSNGLIDEPRLGAMARKQLRLRRRRFGEFLRQNEGDPGVQQEALIGCIADHPAALNARRTRTSCASSTPTPLDAELLGHRHDQRIALLRADHGEPDAGVAARGLDDGCPGVSCPARSAASITPSARRSLTEPSGLNASILAKRLTPGGASRLIRTIGVLPTVPRMLIELAHRRLSCDAAQSRREHRVGQGARGALARGGAGVSGA